MAILKKYVLIVLAFVLDIVLLGYRVIRQLHLPSRRQKGNLLSSLFTFAVGLLERLIRFEKEILVKPVLFRNKYIRQGLQVAAAVFIFLASFEWAGGNTAANHVPLCRTECSTPAENDAAPQPSSGYRALSFTRPRPAAAGYFCRDTGQPGITRNAANSNAAGIYLLNRNLRI